jgi:hypothetical protein
LALSSRGDYPSKVIIFPFVLLECVLSLPIS